MKGQRTHLVGMLIGTGGLLVLATLLWSLGRPGTSRAAAGVDAASAGARRAAPERQAGSTEAKAIDRLGRVVDSATLTSPSPTNAFLPDLVAALESLHPESDIVERERALENLVNLMAITDVPAAVGFLNERDFPETTCDLKLRLLRRWADTDPRAAADYVCQEATGSARLAEIRGVAVVWANQDLAEAVAWLTQLPEEDRENGLLGVAYEATRTEPIEALRLAVELPAGAVRNDLITHAAGQWATSAPQAAAAWADRIDDGALRERVLASVATAWGESDPVAAATMAVQSLAPGQPRDDALVGIVQRWVQQEPERAAAWVAMFPEGRLRQTALDNVVKLWADQNVEQAGMWLSGLDWGNGRDTAIGAYVTQIAPRYPEVAARWAEDIGDNSMRDQQMETVGEAWMASDATAARAWIALTPLQETTKARLFALKPE